MSKMGLLSSKLARASRRIVYAAADGVDLRLHRNTNLTIYCYHGIGGEGYFNVTRDAFIQQIEYLTKHYAPVRLSDIEKMIRTDLFPAVPSFAITFDDGYSSVKSIAEFLSDMNIFPALFPLAVPKKAAREELDSQERLLTAKEIKYLMRLGWEVGCHSATHADFRLISEAEVYHEIFDAKKILERSLHVPVRYFAYPRGAHSSQITESVRTAGFSLALSMDDGSITAKSDPFRLPRVGVNASHGMNEFTALSSPTVMKVRGFIKRSLLFS